MTVRFRIHKIALGTTEGEVEYRFPSDLTVLAGPTGVGKTTLMELIKFGFGADAIVAPVAVEHVESVTLEVRIGESELRLVRNLDRAKRSVVRVTDLIEQQRLPDHHIGDKRQPTLNSLLMQALGLPDDMRAAAGGSSTKEGARITFADILTYIYIPQSEINRDIAHSQDSYREPKRKAVFEILFGLTDAEILGLRSRFSQLRGEIIGAEGRHDAVADFLRDSGTRTQAEAEFELERARLAQEQAEHDLLALRDAVDPVSDRETQTLRDLLTDAERTLSDTRSTHVDLGRQHSQYTAERRRVQGDLQRLDRMRVAGQALASIEFTVCPRCMQSLTQRTLSPDTCRLCLQSDPPADGNPLEQYEVRQLTAQLDEMDGQIGALTHQRDTLERAIAEREQLVAHLTAVLEQRTSDRVTPRLQAFSDASQLAATSRAQQEHWESILRQWDSVADLKSAATTLRTERENVRARMMNAQRALEERRTEILEELSAEFEAIVREIGVPGITSAWIDGENYLPVLNGKIFSKKNQLSGGLTTSTQVAYWCSLLAVAMRHPETAYPAFILIDSPRMALNTATGLAAAMYRKLDTQVAVLPGRLQIIVADNELPKSYQSHYTQIHFSYDHPTVGTIAHPGPAQVAPIHAPADDADSSSGSIPQTS